MRDIITARAAVSYRTRWSAWCGRPCQAASAGPLCYAAAASLRSAISTLPNMFWPEDMPPAACKLLSCQQVSKHAACVDEQSRACTLGGAPYHGPWVRAGALRIAAACIPSQGSTSTQTTNLWPVSPSAVSSAAPPSELRYLGWGGVVGGRWGGEKVGAEDGEEMGCREVEGAER